MHRYGIEDELWFEAARTALERRGFRVRVQPKSIVIEKEQRLPRIVASAREYLEFAERQGMRVEAEACAAADHYGDGTADLRGRTTASVFETPVAAVAVADVSRLEQERLAAGSRAAQEPRPGLPPGVMHEARTAARALEQHCAKLQARAAELEAELAQAARAHGEVAAQRDLYQMSLRAAEARLAALQAEQAAGGPDRKFDQLRRFLARELHPDLAGEDTAARAMREAIFKRVWAKIEQLQ